MLIYSFIPDVAIPSIKNLWQNRNSIINGAIDITVAASVGPYLMELLPTRIASPADSVLFSTELVSMNISTFYMIYTKKALRDRRIPFDIEAPADPFYSEQNMAQLRKSAQQVKEGKIITKTMEDLEAIACE